MIAVRTRRLMVVASDVPLGGRNISMETKVMEGAIVERVARIVVESGSMSE